VEPSPQIGRPVSLDAEAAHVTVAPKLKGRSVENLCVGLAAVWLGITVVTLAGCEQAKQITSKLSRPTYSSCLQTAVGGSHTLSAEDIRALCAEAAEALDAHYEFKDNRMVPSNDFTRCYDKQKKEFEGKKFPKQFGLQSSHVNTQM
jgi:hypothetical protein